MHGQPAATMEVHFKLFGTDGVSLQSQELTKALSNGGWRVHPCASDVPDETEGLRLPELSYQSDEARALRRSIFRPDDSQLDGDRQTTVSDLLEQIEERAARIRQRVEEYLDQHDIRLVHVRNLMSLPYNLAATLAFYRLITERRDVQFILQHHDLYWEGPNARNFQSPYAEVADLIDRITCPDRPNTTHVLINPIAAEALLQRKNVQGVVVPDGFDFDRELIAIDEEAFRSRLEVLTGVRTAVTVNDLVVSMPARVAINKAIELAIQFVAGLDQRRVELEASPDGLGVGRRMLGKAGKIVLLLPQGEDLDDNRDYFERLVAYAEEIGVTLAYGGNIVVPDRRFTAGDSAHYPFYSTYQAIDLVCYPPEHEGFGNQAIEAVWARRPLIALEYAVFKRFVRQHIPHYISLGDVRELGRLEQFGGLHLLRDDVLQRAVDVAVNLLMDHDLESHWVGANATALRRFCGMEIVSRRYIELYEAAGSRRNSGG
ncbi:MAG: hypothetical protein M3082_15530 [Candidatus Dormibacteraeota bacterium]|nr:hypothetical protein [Candidatus Dormibacteraeota bacterium]